MLWTPANDFGWSLDNWGSTFSGTGLGASINSHATNANQKGTASSIWAGSSVTTDVYEVFITFFTSSVAANRFLADILVDPAGGSSWSVLINNLAINTPIIGIGGCCYYFPIFIKAGTSIGIQQQCSLANTSIRYMIMLRGKPSHPEVMRVGSVVETIGAVTASTEGTSFTPGTNAMGSYSSSLGTLTRNAFYFQCGILINDATQTAMIMGTNVEAGDASNKIMVGQGYWHAEPGTTETASKGCVPFGGTGYRNVPKGANIYVRGWATATPDSANSAIVYAVT
jgi:hypothetical protein